MIFVCVLLKDRVQKKVKDSELVYYPLVPVQLKSQEDLINCHLNSSHL